MSIGLPALSAHATARDITCCTPSRGDTLTLQSGQLVWTDNSCCSCSCFGSSESDANKNVWALFEAALTLKHGPDAVNNALKTHNFNDPKAKRKSITPEVFHKIVTHVQSDPASRSVVSLSVGVGASTPSNGAVVGHTAAATPKPGGLPPISEGREESGSVIRLSLEPTTPSHIATLAVAATPKAGGIPANSV